jgi:type IV fimbrial biogenesis protein FimT
MKNRTQGFTLMELMITLALAGVIIGLGVPSYREFTRNSRMISSANDILGGVQTARTEAIKRQLASGGVSLCPSANPEAATPTCLADSARNFNGWIAFVDTDNNCDRADTEEIVRTGARIDLNNTAVQNINSYSNGSCFSFNATGFQNTTSRTAASRVLFCDERGSKVQPGTTLSNARGLEVTNTGRARITRDPTEINSWTDAKCP